MHHDHTAASIRSGDRPCGSASRAAKNLFLSQPNLSSAIKNLEQELGFPIFERTSAGWS